MRKIVIFISTVLLLAQCTTSNVNTVSEGLGCDLDQIAFDKAEVFEPLATSVSENKLPQNISLLQYAPKRLSQGRKGSCTAWAACYAAGTILWSQALQTNPDNLAFSPDFIYNQMTKGNCTGTNIGEALELVLDEGLISLTEFEYDENDCNRQPSSEIKANALQYRLKGFNRLTLNGNDYKVDINAIKQNLAQGAPVVVGMLVGGTFYSLSGSGPVVWEPTRSDYNALKQSTDGHIVYDGNNAKFGGHAMCVIGYDDTFNGGCFQIMNSWGSDWGEDGVFWMPYKDFEYFVNGFYGEAYGLYPLEQKKTGVEFDFVASVGLLLNESKEYINFEFKKGYTFETTEQIPANTKFKIAVRNENECYTYVFGQETDGTSYILFPYTEKHSAYCGITGTRLFPKDYSLLLDNIGSKDVMAVIFTKNEIDYNILNDEINAAKGQNYEDKIRNALGTDLIAGFNYTDGEKITFKAKSEGLNTMVIVFEINK